MNAIDKKVILLFSDLEGTLLRESDGQYDDEAMFHFLEQLDKLEKNTDSKIHLHIVSPVDLTSMKNILKKLDNNICNYNSIKKSNLSIPKGAIASKQNDGFFSSEYTEDRIFLFEGINTYDTFDIARSGKQRYVKEYVDVHKAKDDLAMCIYCGNGRNDIDAMKTVKNSGVGYVLCPKNSRTEVKGSADFVSDKEDILGLTDCFQKLNDRIKTREVNNVKNESDIER